jgi:hypothetical protein
VDRGRVTCTATLVPLGRVAEWTIIREIMTIRGRRGAAVHDSVPSAEAAFGLVALEELSRIFCILKAYFSLNEFFNKIQFVSIIQIH